MQAWRPLNSLKPMQLNPVNCNKSGDVNSRGDRRKSSIPLTSTGLRLLIRGVDDGTVELPQHIQRIYCCGLQQPLEGAVMDSSHALIGTSLSTICACLQVHDCVEQTLLFVPVAVKWTVQHEFTAVRKYKKKTATGKESLLE